MLRYTFIFLLVFSFISCQTLSGLCEEQPLHEPTKHYLKKYNFGTDWFTDQNRIPIWEKMLRQFKGKPDIHYLEVGVYEGRSAIWMLENILTHPSSKLTGIDIFPGDLKKRYLANLSMSGFAHKTTTIEGSSQTELKHLPPNSFDIIYLDGDHRADAVLADAVLSFDLLKTGGLLIFDDYLWPDTTLPNEIIAKMAVDSFITAYRVHIDVVHRGHQLFLKKRKSPYAYFPTPPVACTPIGQYLYIWFWDLQGIKMKELYSQEGELIKLSDKETLLIEKLIKSTKFGETKLFLDSKMARDKDFINLSARLKLDFTNIEIKE
ncbi:MAG: class I SAM-dependent methyltransferase [Deltaproteobacteria bacterium]|nr:class I SAM-dependent methyltransferase [Deltaproteobacteria bacterium]